jgi:hemerythrin
MINNNVKTIWRITMPFLWHDKYYIGVEEIDMQHKTFLEMLNKANDAYSSSSKSILDEKGKLAVYSDVLKLREYAFNHFFTEEKCMIKHKYPKFFDHKREHDNFVKAIFEMEEKLFGSEDMTPGELVDFIINWYKTHVTRVDREFGDYLASLKRSESV